MTFGGEEGEHYLFVDFKLGTGITGNLNNHVEDSLLLVGPQGDIVERAHASAILLWERNKIRELAAKKHFDCTLITNRNRARIQEREIRLRPCLCRTCCQMRDYLNVRCARYCSSYVEANVQDGSNWGRVITCVLARLRKKRQLCGTHTDCSWKSNTGETQ